MRRPPESGQALLLVVGLLCAVLVGAVVLGAVARAVAGQGERQRAADLAALSGASAMRAAYGRLFEPPLEPGHLERAAYLALGRAAAVETARRNGHDEVRVTFPDGDAVAPLRIRVAVGGDEAEAQLVPPGGGLAAGAPGAGEYPGPFAHRQGKPMRPDVAAAFDRMAAAARAAGHDLVIASAFRGDAEQARLFAARPDPKWVARPGQSLHRLGTELDLGPPSAYGWLAANAGRFHFVKRYAWEPWHFGFTLNAGSASVGYGRGADGVRARPLQGFVPERFAPMLSRAAQRWNVSAALLAAQLHAESGFNPFARSPAGAQGIAQFMPGTARSYGLRDPFDAGASIDAQAHMMRDLLRRFGSVPLALAAYNAGAGAVAALRRHPAVPGDPALRRDDPRPAQRRGGRGRRGGRWTAGAARGLSQVPVGSRKSCASCLGNGPVFGR